MNSSSCIAADMLPHIFEMFTQAQSSVSNSAGGLGIALTLVRKLVEMHGGRIAAQSEGHGQETKGSQETKEETKGSGVESALPTLDHLVSFCHPALLSLFPFDYPSPPSSRQRSSV
jgi:signal transduction histidine kinase